MKSLSKWSSVYAASFAAAAVVLSASPASAEARATEFETEFELDLAPAVAVHAAATQAPADANKPCIQGVAAKDTCPLISASTWETAIGAYLDNLLERSNAVSEVLAPAPEGSETPLLTVEELSAAAPGYELQRETEPAVVHASAAMAGAPHTALCPDALAEAAGWQMLAQWASERLSTITGTLDATAARHPFLPPAE
jgi:hypothetical protein